MDKRDWKWVQQCCIASDESGYLHHTTQTGKVLLIFKVHQKSYTIQSTITGLSVGNHTLSTPQIPSHTHNMPNAGSGDGVAGNTPSNQDNVLICNRVQICSKGGG